MSLRFDPRLPLTSETRRIAGEDVQNILTHLETARRDPETGLHDARKRIKSLRALLRLVQTGLLNQYAVAMLLGLLILTFWLWRR